jgi:hypothetical protein
MFQGDHPIEKQRIAAHQKPMEPVFLKDAKKKALPSPVPRSKKALWSQGFSGDAHLYLWSYPKWP